MACETCDHTMECVSDYGPSCVWWCPRCGTIKHGTNGEYDIESPKLVARVIEFASTLTCAESNVIANFERLGIREAVTPPGLV